MSTDTLKLSSRERGGSAVCTAPSNCTECGSVTILVVAMLLADFCNRETCAPVMDWETSVSVVDGSNLVNCRGPGLAFDGSGGPEISLIDESGACPVW